MAKLLYRALAPKIKSEIPLNGILSIRQNGNGVAGSFEFEKGEYAGAEIDLKTVQFSGKRIGFAFSSKQLDVNTPVDKMWAFFGSMQNDAKSLVGKVHERLPMSGNKDFKEFEWSATKLV